MPKRDEKIAERRSYAQPSGHYLRRLFIVVAVALATFLMSVPVTTVAQQDGNACDGSALCVGLQQFEPTEDELAAGVVISRLDTSVVGVKGLPAGEYDLVLQSDGEGHFRLHAVEVGSKRIYEDIASPALIDTVSGKELNIDLPGDGEGENLRPVRICVTVSGIIRVYGIPIHVSVTVCVTVNIS